ncbi:hypothetical protein BJ165DRAFT_1534505 [Panaeolus papilionaceus]|nr:hypothetical protein BJ165DRAFT_1534505 [Panaeolus papilionaceus]
MQHQSTVNINQLLSPYVGPLYVDSFRYIMYRCGILAGGEGLLELLTGQRVFRKPPLDLFLIPSNSARLCEYLVSIGYSYEEDNEAYGSPRPWLAVSLSSEGSAARWSFSKGDLKMVVVICPRSPFESVMSRGNSCLMTIATYEKIYCPYPEGTLKKKKVMITRSGDGGRTEWEKKYGERGWNIIKDWGSLRSTGRVEFKPGVRWLGDDICRVWNLTPEVGWDDKGANQAECNGWALRKGEEGNKPTLQYKLTGNWHNVKYRYTVPDFDAQVQASLLFSTGPDLCEIDGYKDDELSEVLQTHYLESREDDG